jgi:transposase
MSPRAPAWHRRTGIPEAATKQSGAHRELILNYFKAKKQFSSGVVEGLNNKVKVTMRKSYGFRTFRITELALYHALGKLPEPKLTHEFF